MNWGKGKKIRKVDTVFAIASWKNIVLSSTFCANTICMEVVKFESQTSLQWWFLMIVRVIFKTTKWKVSQIFSSGLLKERGFQAVYSTQVNNWTAGVHLLFCPQHFPLGEQLECEAGSLRFQMLQWQCLFFFFLILCYCSVHWSHLCC